MGKFAIWEIRKILTGNSQGEGREAGVPLACLCFVRGWSRVSKGARGRRDEGRREQRRPDHLGA